MKNPIRMDEATLAKLARGGRYPFCQCCGNEVRAGDLVHRRVTKYPGGSKVTKYFCDGCERSGRMYADGEGQENR